MATINTDEIQILDALGSVWNDFIALPEAHPSDQGEFAQAIHAAQNIVLARVGLRAMDEMIQKQCKFGHMHDDEKQKEKCNQDYDRILRAMKKFIESNKWD
jgi:hypothetical protein